IEKETGLPTERAQIAAVFVNRLRLGMKLQTDPTVIYGIKDRYDGNIRRSDLTDDNPYNTYIINGLPPTPIAMPGKASIEAALNPETTDYLYFVAKGGGAHHFSKTLEEHNRAVHQYLLKKS
ncbi:MAG: endolytic transglycosylase MltG, partial [Aeromonas sp.]